MITVAQITTSPPRTPPMMAPRLFGESLEESSSDELLVVSVEVFSAAWTVLDIVSVGTTDDVGSCEVVCSVIFSAVVVVASMGVTR